jgi:ketosteroid isomerase-like protein
MVATRSQLDQVQTSERMRRSAMISGDVHAIAACLDDDLIYIHSNGVIDTKESYVSALKTAQYVYESVEVLETRHLSGVDVAVLCQILSAKIRLGRGHTNAGLHGRAGGGGVHALGGVRAAVIQEQDVQAVGERLAEGVKKELEGVCVQIRELQKEAFACRWGATAP